MNDEHWNDELRERLQEALAGTSNREIARMTGLSGESIRRYLKSGRPSPAFLAAICRVYGINANWLLLGIGPKDGTRLHEVARDLVDWRRVIAAAKGAIEEEVGVACTEFAHITNGKPRKRRSRRAGPESGRGVDV